MLAQTKTVKYEKVKRVAETALNTQVPVFLEFRGIHGHLAPHFSLIMRGGDMAYMERRSYICTEKKGFHMWSVIRCVDEEGRKITSEGAANTSEAIAALQY